MRSWAYNRFGVLMGASWLASGLRWPSLRVDVVPMITLFPSQGYFCATAHQRLLQQQTQVFPARSKEVILRQAISSIARDDVGAVSLYGTWVNTGESLDESTECFFQEIGVFVGDRLGRGVRLVKQKDQRHHDVILAARGAPDVVHLCAQFLL